MLAVGCHGQWSGGLGELLPPAWRSSRLPGRSEARATGSSLRGKSEMHVLVPCLVSGNNVNKTGDSNILKEKREEKREKGQKRV